MKELPPSLERWHAYPQFVLCDGKVPCNPNKQPVDPHNPTNWMSASEACGMSESLGLGVGFVFTVNDPFFFIDLDHCIVDGAYTEPANTIIGMFPGAALEVSTSGTGVHIFGTGTAPPHSKKDAELGIEFYTEGRYALLTGNEAQDSDVWLDWTPQLETLTERWFEIRESRTEAWTDQPVPEWSGPTDDTELINKMLAARGSAAQQMGNRATIADLWYNNEPALAHHYANRNPESDAPYDRSSADAALSSHLAWWTGGNHVRIWNLMWQSQLVRDKWNVKGYMQRTITNAVNQCTGAYTDQRTSGVNDSSSNMNPQTGSDGTQTGSETNRTSGFQFMTIDQQIIHFADCYYIENAHRVLIPDGRLLKPDQFKAKYGGYTFAMDNENGRDVRNAWEAFIENQGYRFPKVAQTTFNPQLEPYQIITENGLKMVNNYVKLDIKRIPGNVDLFMDHITNLFPDPNDREIILAYMAAVVQHQGVKFQWCPVIQGVEGNGKTLINRCIEHAVGSRYCHYPNASELATGGLKFNGWIENIIFAAIEEMYTGHSRFDLLDSIKPMLTNDRLEIQRKGQDQYTGTVVCNFIMNTNHKDAIKVTYDQRRYWMNYTAQQSKADLVRDGMNDKYFQQLYDWLKKEDGYAMVSEFLHTYQIPAHLNPAGICQRAPASTSDVEAVYTSLGPVQQHILEAIEEDRQGFKGGYISSYAVTQLLKDTGHKLSPRVMSTMIIELGYVKLTRISVLNEGGKPVIYARADMEPADRFNLKQDYETKQGYVPPGQLEVVK